MMYKILAVLTLPVLILATQAPGNTQALVKNSCPYDVSIDSISGNKTYEGSNRHQTLVSGGDYTESFRDVGPFAGVSLKVSIANSSNITQFEYAYHSHGTVQYDISFLDCAKKSSTTSSGYDASSCPGHAYGVKATAGTNCKEFICEPEEVCIDEAYWIPENGYQNDAPNYACDADAGVAFELCYAY
jgi:hypothetical protein